MLRTICLNVSGISGRNAQCHLIQRHIKVSSVLLSKTFATSVTKGEGNQVYYGALTPQIRMVKVFSLATSVTGVIFQPMLYQRMAEVDSMPLTAAALGIVGFFTFVTPLLLHLVTKKYVTNMTFDPVKDEYTAETITFLLRKRKINFKIDDVKIPEVPGMFTSVLVKGVPLFVDPRMFHDPEHYIKMMGYDKPIDFKLGLTEKEKDEEKK